MLEVTLRSVACHDAERLFKWRSADEIDRWMFSEPPASFDAHVEWLEGLLERDDRWQWIIEVRDHPVGLLTLGASHEPGVLDLGIYVAELTSRGVGAKALVGLLAKSRSMGLGARIRADVFADNARAINLYEKLGFVKELNWLEDCTKRGVVRPIVRYEKDLGDGKSSSSSGSR